jgi:chromosome segregation ATPase
MSKEETQEALEKANKIIDEWKENLIESREAMELIAPLVESITTYFEKIQDEIDKLNY